MPERLNFKDYLERQSSLTGIGYFITLLPELCLNHITNAGSITMRAGTLRYFEYPSPKGNPNPKARSSEEIDAMHSPGAKLRRGVFYLGHFISFGRSKYRERGSISDDDLLTFVDSSIDAPNQKPNRRYLRHVLSSPSELTPSTPPEQIFRLGKILGGRTLIVRTGLTNPHQAVIGEVKPYWESYWHNIGRPLFSALRT